MNKRLTQLLRTHVDSEFPSADRLLPTRIKSDPYSMGAYSYLQNSGTSMDMEAMCRPIYSNEKPLLLFAGEACHSRYFCTVHGVFMTGRDAATLLI